MATVKEWLIEEGFDEESGRIVLQECGDSNYPGWRNRIRGRVVDLNDPTLTKEFHDGFGSPECPAVIAEDKEALYFPEQYDGSTRLCKVYKNLDRYLGEKAESTPYPGG